MAPRGSGSAARFWLHVKLWKSLVPVDPVPEAAFATSFGLTSRGQVASQSFFEAEHAMHLFRPQRKDKITSSYGI